MRNGSEREKPICVWMNIGVDVWVVFVLEKH